MKKLFVLVLIVALAAVLAKALAEDHGHTI